MAWDPCGLSKINAFVLARTGIIYLSLVTLRKELLENMHEELCHVGAVIVYQTLAFKYHWKHLFADVMRHCLHDCTTCMEYNLKKDIVP